MLTSVALFWLYYGKMWELSQGIIESRLTDVGISKSNARLLARVILDEFNASGSPQPETEQHLIDTVSGVVAAIVIMRKSILDNLKLKLPARAPLLWKNRSDRLPNETPIDFLRRVWGRYMDAGVLYQDHLARRGEQMLVSAIRGYCDRNGLKAADHLPPPKGRRLRTALEEAVPGSVEHELYLKRLRLPTRAARARSELRLR